MDQECSDAVSNERPQPGDACEECGVALTEFEIRRCLLKHEDCY